MEKTQKVLNFKVVVNQDEDGIFVATVPSVPGCHSQGKTFEEARKNIKEAVELCLEVAESRPDYKNTIDFSNMRDNFVGVIDVPVRVATI